MLSAAHGKQARSRTEERSDATLDAVDTAVQNITIGSSTVEHWAPMEFASLLSLIKRCQC